MWWLKLKVSEAKLPEIVNIIRKRFFLPAIHTIEKEREEYSDYIVTFSTTSTLEEILQILREEDLFYYLIAIERGA